MRTLALALALAASPLCTAQPEFSSVDALIEDSLAQIGGGAALLLVQDGDVLHRRGYGTFSATSVKRTASGAKWLSGGVIASLLSDGTLTLDDSLAQFFPSLEGAKRAITVRQLFGLTSGMRGNDDVGGRAACIQDRRTTLAACAEAILALPLARAPGSGFAYGSNSMHVAGRVAEIATGTPWVTLFDERIAQPLGMTDTGYTNVANPWIAAGMTTTVDDYGAFLQMLLDGGVYDGQRVLSEAAVEALLADQTEGAPVVSSPLDRYAGYPGFRLTREVYGLGVWREGLAPDGSILEASSPGALGLTPWIDTERRIAGVLLTEDRLPDVMGTYLELKRLVRDIVDGTATPLANALQSRLRLDAPRPNPTRRRALLRYALPEAADVRLDLVDVSGRRVLTLDAGPRAAGDHRAVIDTEALAAGTYRAVLRAGGEVQAQSVVVAR